MKPTFGGPPLQVGPGEVPGPARELSLDALERRFQMLDGLDARTLGQSAEAQNLLQAICIALENGNLRAAEQDPSTGVWTANGWLKQALVTLGNVGDLAVQPGVLPGTEFTALGWNDQRTLQCRIPAGSFIRRGVYLARGTTVMPPSTLQAGAYLAAGVRVDSHVLIGSCAQIGEDVIVGAGSVLAGLLLPASTLPVILERNVLLAGECGLYGSVHVGEASVLHPGTCLQAAHGLYDATRAQWIAAGEDGTLHVPPRCEIVMGLPPPAAGRQEFEQLTAIIIRREE